MSQTAPQGDCFGRAPPSLRCPPAINTIHLPERTYRQIWTPLLGVMRSWLKVDVLR